MNAVLLETMHRQADVFSTDQAARAGISRDDLRSLQRRHEVYRVRRDAYTTAAHWDAGPAARHRIEVAAALLNRGGFDEGGPLLVAGHRSAGCLWGLDLPWSVIGRRGDEVPRLALPGDDRPVPTGIELVAGNRGKRTYRAGVSVRPAQLPEAHRTHLDRVPVTSLARTAVDLMRESGRIDALVIADQTLRLGCAQNELVETAEFCAGWRGGKQALEMARFADGRSQSGAQSLGRLRVHEHGMPKPVPQYEIRDARGRRRLLDLAFVDQWTTLEPDGKVKYDKPYGNPGDVLWEEKLREDAIRDVGWEVVRATWHELHREPQRVIARLRAAFARAQLRHAS